jgi:drug/metabolite transporter (DMT)-like permease
LSLQFGLAVLVLCAAFAHAAWNALIKASGDSFLTFAMLRVVCFLGGATGALLLPLPDAAAWPYLIASAIVHNIYYLLVLYSYRHGDLSLVYPIARGAAPALVVGAAFVFAGEALAAGGALGIALVTAGIFALAFARGWPRGADRRAITLALGTAVTIVAYTVIDGLGARASLDAVAYAAWLFSLESIPFMIFALGWRAVDFASHVRRQWPRGLAGGLLMMLTYGVVIYAFAHGALAYVSALRETSVLFAAIIGAFLLKESFGPRRIAAAAAIVAGIVLMQVAG